MALPRPGDGAFRRRLTARPPPSVEAIPAGESHAAKTLYDKIWDAHLVDEAPDGTCLIYIDRHLVHEVTSPQAFEGLRMAGRKVRAPGKTVAVPDHNVPTDIDRAKGIENEESRIQVDTLRPNAREFGVELYDVADIRQGIVHIIGPEQGLTQPGMTIVCGDSHTATHGAFGALAHGIGTSEVEHVLATQTLIQRKSKNMKVEVQGSLAAGVTAKDITLSIIGATGTAGGNGHVIEYCGEAIRVAVDGRPDDRLQHGDRGRRPRRADRAGRQDLCLRQGPPARAEGRRLGAGRGLLAHALHRRGRALRPRGGARRRPDRPGRHLGDEPRGRAADHRHGAAPRGLQGRQGRRGAAAASSTWA